jgi:hypothetical protein
LAFVQGKDWFDLYLAVEGLEAHVGGGEAKLPQHPGADANLKRAKQMANSFRHSGGVHSAPKPPMTLSEARKVILNSISGIVATIG